VVEENEDLIRRLVLDGIPYLMGDPNRNDVMLRAGIRDAKVLIVNYPSEEVTSNVLLTASEDFDGRAIALIEDFSKSRFVRLAGASEVISLTRIGGRYMGKQCLNPQTFELFEAEYLHKNLRLMDFMVTEDSQYNGLRLGELTEDRTKGVAVIGIKKNEVLNLDPSPDTIIKKDDILTFLGNSDRIDNLEDSIEIKEKSSLFLCGFGGFWGAIFEEVKGTYSGIKIIDREDQDTVILKLDGAEHIKGDSTNEVTLMTAGIRQASIVVIALGKDADNIYTTLLVRNLNKTAPIFVRAISKDAERKLFSAGATHVVTLSTLGGKEIASKIEGSSPESISLSNDIKIEKVLASPKFQGKSIKDLRIGSRTGCIIVGFEREGKFYPNPSRDELIEDGTKCFCMGTRKEINSFIKTFGTKRFHFLK